MTPLTPKQKRFLNFVIEHTEREGYSPSQAEIARALGFRSLGTVQNYLNRLEREGLIEKDWNARRGIRVRLPEEYGYQLPLAGIVSAGRPIEAVETPDTIPVPPTMADEGNFVLRIEGDSMIEDGILDGDYIVVRKQNHADRGQTIVALLGNEATVKRFYRIEDRIELRPANAAMEPIIVRDTEEFSILGVVVGVIRHLK